MVGGLKADDSLLRKRARKMIAATASDMALLRELSAIVGSELKWSC